MNYQTTTVKIRTQQDKSLVSKSHNHWRRAIANALDLRIRRQIQGKQAGDERRLRREHVCDKSKLALRDLSGFLVNDGASAHVELASAHVELARLRYRTQPTTTMSAKRHGSSFIVHLELDLWRPCVTTDIAPVQFIHNVHVTCSLETEAEAADANIFTQSGLIPTLRPGESVTLSLIIDASGIAADIIDDCSSGVLGIQLVWNLGLKNPLHDQHHKEEFRALLLLPPDVLVAPQRKLQDAIVSDFHSHCPIKKLYPKPSLFFESRIPREIRVDIADCDFALDAWVERLNEALEGTMHNIVGQVATPSYTVVLLVLLAYPSWEYDGLLGLVKRNLPAEAIIIGVVS